MRGIVFTFIGIAVVLSLLVVFGQGVAHEGGAIVVVELSEGEHRLDVDFGVTWDTNQPPTTGPDSPTVTPTGTTPTLRNKTTLALLLIALLSYWLWRRRPKDEQTVGT